MKHLALALVLFTAGCKKSDDPKPAPAAGSSVTAGSATAGSAAPTPVDPNADFISVFGSHQTPKPNDPVEVHFDRFKVTKAAFDPKTVEGGTATIELDLSSLHTDSGKRDAHLKSESYIDVSKFATATIDVDNVKKKEGQTYTADAHVKFHGVDKTYPVTFDVVEQQDDHIRIKGEQTFDRTDFQVGKAVGDTDESVAGPLTIKLQLTLAKT